jgi:hypothetical protein
MELLRTTLISALVGAVVSFLGALFTSALGARSRIDEQLRSIRVELYEPLWKATKLLPKWPRARGVTRGDLHRLATELRDLYFNRAGMYLSKGSMRAYRALQDTIGPLAKAEDTTSLQDPEYDKAREACSRLRSELTADLLSRSRTLVLG